MQVLNNRIYGRQQPFTNVGLYVWNQAQGPCAGHVVRGNAVSWKNSKGADNPAWNAGNCGEVSGWQDNQWNAPMIELQAVEKAFGGKP